MKENIMVEIAMKMEEGHWVVSTVLWPLKSLPNLTFKEYKILRRFNFDELHSRGTDFNIENNESTD
jgi:hypothetical protein